MRRPDKYLSTLKPIWGELKSWKLTTARDAHEILSVLPTTRTSVSQFSGIMIAEFADFNGVVDKKCAGIVPGAHDGRLSKCEQTLLLYF